MTTPTPAKYLYSKEHEWIELDGQTATLGITDYAQHALGDLVFVDLPTVGHHLEKGKAFAVVESVKAASEVFAPLDGEVLELNNALRDAPELVNQDPYGKGWIAKIKLASDVGIKDLMSAADYDKFTKRS